MTKIGEFHGETEGSICPGCNCSVIKDLAASSFSLDRGHWGTHTAFLVNQGMGTLFISEADILVAPKKNPNPSYPYFGWVQ